MDTIQPVALMLVLAGLALVVIGGLLLVAGRIPLLGRLPGDFSFNLGGVRVYAPLATSLLLSLVLTLVLSLIVRR